MGGGGGGDSTVYTNLVPDYIPGFQTWVEAYLAEAYSLSGSNFSAYPDPTYAAQDTNEVDGITALALRGRGGSDIELDGKALLRDIYDGNKININTKIDAAYSARIAALIEQFQDEALPSIRNAHVFAWGSSDHNRAEALAVKAILNKIHEIGMMYYEDYHKERSLQHQAMSHATPYGLQCIRDMEMLRMAGLYAREYTQKGYINEWEKWNEEIIIPTRNLDILGNAVRTILSTTRTSSTKYYKPPTWTQVAGAAISGLALYSMYSGTSLNPYTKGVASGGAGGAVQTYNPNTQSSMGIPIE